MRRLLLILTVVCFPVVARAWQVPEDTLKAVELAPIVVTATRSERSLEDVAVPTTVIVAETIQRQGALRLGDILASLTGLALVDDHGTGLQIQGFAPDYTLILLDGEPVIGRTAGTLDLGRLALKGLNRVEIVRGPSSSLYGSDALAGVVNLITSIPADGRRVSVNMRTGTFSATDFSAQVEGSRNGTGGRLTVNRYASGGYDLTPDFYGTTAPSFANWTADLRGRAAVSDRFVVRLGVRGAMEDQTGTFATRGEDSSEKRFENDGRRIEWSIHPEADIKLYDRLRLTTTMYGAGYQTETVHRRLADGVSTYTDDFDQRYLKGEVQLDALWNGRHVTSLGGGGVREFLGGGRYALDGEKQLESSQHYFFAQHAWLASQPLRLNMSGRLDRHSDYAPKLTPKFSVLYRPSETFQIRASVGSGFKAPAFRQFYLAFTNASAGYSVFGSTRLADGIARLQDEGQIDQVFIDVGNLQGIRAESSVALNVGATVEPLPWLTLQANAFYNDVEDLIETQPVAQKKNGQFVYGYFNTARIYTRGVEAEIDFHPMEVISPVVNVTLGYQFLQARDREVVQSLKRGFVYGRDPNGSEYQLGLGNYGGMFGRSPHMVSLRVMYVNMSLGLAANVRGRWRSRYGYRDLDGNRIANRPDEFVPAYAVVGCTVTKMVSMFGVVSATIQVGAENAFDHTYPTLIPSLPGRRIFGALQIDL